MCVWGGGKGRGEGEGEGEGSTVETRQEVYVLEKFSGEISIRNLTMSILV